jgi:lysozyme
MKRSIGWSHVITPKEAPFLSSVTPERADAMLLSDIAWAETAVDRDVRVPLNDNQFSALVCFVYNIGDGAFEHSTLVRLLNGRDYADVPAQLHRWDKVEGQESAGLDRRRQAENDLWAKAA